jgi:hypothetical protein
MARLFADWGIDTDFYSVGHRIRTFWPVLGPCKHNKYFGLLLRSVGLAFNAGSEEVMSSWCVRDRSVCPSRFVLLCVLWNSCTEMCQYLRPCFSSRNAIVFFNQVLRTDCLGILKKVYDHRVQGCIII